MIDKLLQRKNINADDMGNVQKYVEENKMQEFSGNVLLQNLVNHRISDSAIAQGVKNLNDIREKTKEVKQKEIEEIKKVYDKAIKQGKNDETLTRKRKKEMKKKRNDDIKKVKIDYKMPKVEQQVKQAKADSALLLEQIQENQNLQIIGESNALQALSIEQRLEVMSAPDMLGMLEVSQGNATLSESEKKYNEAISDHMGEYANNDQLIEGTSHVIQRIKNKNIFIKKINRFDPYDHKLFTELKMAYHVMNRLENHSDVKRQLMLKDPEGYQMLEYSKKRYDRYKLYLDLQAANGITGLMDKTEEDLLGVAGNNSELLFYREKQMALYKTSTVPLVKGDFKKYQESDNVPKVVKQLQDFDDENFLFDLKKMDANEEKLRTEKRLAHYKVIVNEQYNKVKSSTYHLNYLELEGLARPMVIRENLIREHAIKNSKNLKAHEFNLRMRYLEEELVKDSDTSTALKAVDARIEKDKEQEKLSLQTLMKDGLSEMEAKAKIIYDKDKEYQDTHIAQLKEEHRVKKVEMNKVLDEKKAVENQKAQLMRQKEEDTLQERRDYYNNLREEVNEKYKNEKYAVKYKKIEKELEAINLLEKKEQEEREIIAHETRYAEKVAARKLSDERNKEVTRKNALKKEAEEKELLEKAEEDDEKMREALRKEINEKKAEKVAIELAQQKEQEKEEQNRKGKNPC